MKFIDYKSPEKDIINQKAKQIAENENDGFGQN